MLKWFKNQSCWEQLGYSGKSQTCKVKGSSWPLTRSYSSPKRNILALRSTCAKAIKRHSNNNNNNNNDNNNNNNKDSNNSIDKKKLIQVKQKQTQKTLSRRTQTKRRDNIIFKEKQNREKRSPKTLTKIKQVEI